MTPDKHPNNGEAPRGRPELVDADLVASILRVSRETVLEWARTGRIPSRRFGTRIVRFALEEVLEAEAVRRRPQDGEEVAE